jgi:Tfp pilus assembly protein PilZ
MDRRRSRRWPRQLDIRFWKRGEEGQPTRAVSTNVSRTGIFLRTPQVLPSGARLRLEVNCAGRSFVAEGVVMRALRSAPHLQAAIPSGMGVRFLSVEELLEDLLPGINLLADEQVPDGGATATLVAHDVPAARPDPYTAPPSRPAPVPAPPSPMPSSALPGAPIGSGVVFPLRFRDREQFQRAFARDIQTGGLFVSTETPPPLDSMLVVEVTIDGVPVAPVRLQARVVHRLDPPPGGAAGNLLVGVGVQFLDVGRAVEELRSLLGA